MKVKTSELNGPALDLAVAKATDADDISITEFGTICCIYELACGSGCWTSNYQPSTCWSDGGHLVSKYRMDFCCEHPETIGAALCDENGLYIDDRMMFGKSHLVAACRAIVAAKLGDEIDVPDELL